MFPWRGDENFVVLECSQIAGFFLYLGYNLKRGEEKLSERSVIVIPGTVDIAGFFLGD